MIIQISVAVVALAVVVLVCFRVMALARAKKAIEALQVDLHALSIESLYSLRRINELTADLQKKSHSLDFIFNSLNSFNKQPDLEKGEEQSEPRTQTVSQVMEWLATSVALAKKTKEFIKNYGK